MRRMDPLNTLIVGAVVVSLGFIQSAAAVVYQWKNDKGEYYFTDDLNKVPLQFRSKATIETVRGTGNLPPTTIDSPPSSDASKEKPSKTASLTKEDKPKVEKKSRVGSELKKMAEEAPLIREAVAHLDVEMKRDEELSTYLPTMVNGKYMVEAVQRLLPAKKALAEKITKSESPSLKETLNFLLPSIVKDTQERYSTDQGMQTRTYQLLDRVKAELSTMKHLVVQLNGDMARVNQGLTSTLSFTPPPEFPKMEVMESPETPETTEPKDAVADAGGLSSETISSEAVNETDSASPPVDTGGTESFEKISDLLKKGGIKFPKID